VRDIRAMSRVGRENQIIMAFLQAMKRTNTVELTSYDIARLIGLRATSPQFRTILSDMVRAGKLIQRVVQDDSLKIGGGKRAFYRLPDEMKPQEREIKVKSNGVAIGQIKLI